MITGATPRHWLLFEGGQVDAWLLLAARLLPSLSPTPHSSQPTDSSSLTTDAARPHPLPPPGAVEAVARRYLPEGVAPPPGMVVGRASLTATMLGSHMAPTLEVALSLPEASASCAVTLRREAARLSLASPHADAAGTVHLAPPSFDAVKAAITQVCGGAPLSRTALAVFGLWPRDSWYAPLPRGTMPPPPPAPSPHPRRRRPPLWPAPPPRAWTPRSA